MVLTRLRQSRILSPAVLAMLAGLVYVMLVLARAGGDPMAFVVYDGNFAYQIALRMADAPPFLDVPAYRFQRIFYPLVSHWLALGRADLVPWALIGVNIAAIGAGTWAMSKLLARLDVSRWYGLVYGLYGGQYVALRANLTEPLAYGLVALALLAWEKERRWLAVAAFSLAALTKEVTLVFPFAYGCYLLLKRDWRWAMGVGTAVLPFAILQLVLWRWLGAPGIGSGGAGATAFSLVPFGGWLSVARVNFTAFLLISLMVVPISVIPTLAGIGLSLRQMRAGLRHPFVMSLLLNSVALLFLPASTFREGAAMVRLTQGAMMSMLLFGGLTKSRRVLNYSVLWIFSNVLLVKGVA